MRKHRIWRTIVVLALGAIFPLFAGAEGGELAAEVQQVFLQETETAVDGAGGERWMNPPETAGVWKESKGEQAPAPAEPEADLPEENAADEPERNAAGEDAAFLTAGNPELEGEEKAEPGETPGLTGAAAGQVPISNLQVTKIAANPKYSRLTFLFQDEASAEEYKCLISGMRVAAENTTEGYRKLAQEIALYFLSGQSLRLTNEGMASRYGLNVDLIDAEKKNVISGEDTSMCWAASAADMIEYAGWNVQADEDEAFADISSNFNNLGGTQQAAISWYMNGVNPGQLVNDSGMVLYADTSTGAAQQQTAGSGGYHMEYSADAVSPDNGSFDDVRGLMEKGAAELEEGSALGIGVYSYRNGQYQGEGHSLTVFGYIGEWIHQAVGRLRAIFVADSDSDAAGQSTKPEDRVNAYTMYHLEDYSTEDLQTVSLKGYRNAENTKVVVGTVTSLAPEAKAAAEKEGTMDARKSVNLVPVDAWVENESGVEISEAVAGDTVYVPVKVYNRSYANLPADAVMEITLHTTWNGIRLADRTMTIGTGEINALEGGMTSMSFDVLAPGEYQFQMEVTGLVDGSGKKIREAYTSDNKAGKVRSITVKAAESETGTEPEPSVIETLAPDGSPRAISGMTEKICRTEVAFGQENTYEVQFSARDRSSCVFGNLLKMKTNEIVNRKCYEIIWKNGKYQIRFAELFLRTLKPGENEFKLVYDGGRIIIQIVIP